MNENSTVDDIKHFVNNVDIDNLIDILDFVQDVPIPGIEFICKLLKYILKLLKPFQNKIQESSSPSVGLSDSAASPLSEAEKKINMMINLAFEDGVITSAEKNFILMKAVELGLDREIVELKLKSKQK